MTIQKQRAIRAAVKAKPTEVVLALRMLAVKAGLNDPTGAESFAARLQEALAYWDAEVLPVLERVHCGEIEFARMLIERLRTNPEYGWDRILRGGAN